MRLDTGKAILCLTMLCEGASVRSIARITGVHKTTILKLMVYAGEKLAGFMADTIRGVSVEDVECDELWGFVGMKEKTKAAKASTTIIVETPIVLSHLNATQSWSSLGILGDEQTNMQTHS